MNKLTGTVLIRSAVIIAWITSCSGEKHSDRIRAVHVEHHVPVSIWTDKIPDQDLYYTVYYYKDLTMYKYNYTYDSIWNGTLMLREKRHVYFIFQNESASGYYFDSIQGIDSFRLLPVDSVCKSNSLENYKLDSLESLKADSTYFEGRDMIRMYHIVPERKSVMRTKIYLYYSKEFTGIRERLSRRMDTLSDKKLYRIRMVFDSIPDADDPRRQVFYGMKNVPVPDEDKLLEYFRIYQAANKIK